jgi:hypothetical protein
MIYVMEKLKWMTAIYAQVEILGKWPMLTRIYVEFVKAMVAHALVVIK